MNSFWFGILKGTSKDPRFKGTNFKRNLKGTSKTFYKTKM